MCGSGPSDVTVPQLGMEAGAGVVWHPGFVSETLGVCSLCTGQLGWLQRDKHSASTTSWLK